ncbi:hypothetical protein [Chlamydia sp. 17-3921]|uniref:hypothetical protein n=1 Tax=Chlamydia sp. 17-3921 TaxID=2675798 RepID=UPI001917C55C|nr:hypothetical protein [Chlamydia sp. 17-3921]
MTQSIPTSELSASQKPKSYKINQETVNRLANFVEITLLISTILTLLASAALFIAGITCAIIFAAPVALMLSLSGLLLPGLILKCLSPNQD